MKQQRPSQVYFETASFISGVVDCKYNVVGFSKCLKSILVFVGQEKPFSPNQNFFIRMWQ